MRNLLTRAGALAAVFVAASGMMRAQNDPRVGTWVLNLAKSKYTPGPPPAKESRTYAVTGETITVSVESVNQKGTRVSLRYAAAEDGKDYPLAGLTAGNAIAMKRIDARTFEADTKKDGKVVGTTMGEIAKDGKSLTLTFKTTAPNGQAINNVAVYEKQ